MRLTRLSLFYLASYLLGGGLTMLLAPQLALKLLFSNGSYPDAIVRTAGVAMTALGLIVVQIIRHRLDVLYPTTLGVRAFILAAFAGLYFTYRDPFFAVLFCVVGLGVLLTGTSYLLDKRTARAAH